MKKFFFLILLSTFFFNVYSQNKKAIKLFNQANELLEKVPPLDWGNSSPEMEKVIEKLDKAIKLAPDWWNPYRQKIQLRKMTSWQINANYVYEVYSLWLKNGNSLTDWNNFSYACALYCNEKTNQAMEMFEKIFSKNISKNSSEEDKVIFLFSGIILRKITIDNLSDFVFELFDNKNLNLFEDFLLNFSENNKDTLWSYVG